MKFETLRLEYRRLWRTFKFRASKRAAVDKAAKLIIKNKARYLEAQKATGVPWFLIGALHYRESSCSFKKHLHEGSPLTDRTKYHPKGHPKKGEPPFTWLESAYDALVNLKGLNKVKEWTIERICYEAERYNGFGYRKNDYPLSPYLWQGSEHYTKGKYVKDHVYNPRFVDPQMGVISIIKRIDELDDSFDLEHSDAPFTTVMKGSRSLWSIILGAFMYVGTQLTDAIQTTWDTALSVLAVIPALVSGVEDQIGPTEQLAGWLGIDWGLIGKYLILLTLAQVFVRVYRNKVDLEKVQDD